MRGIGLKRWNCVTGTFKNKPNSIEKHFPNNRRPFLRSKDVTSIESAKLV